MRQQQHCHQQPHAWTTHTHIHTHPPTHTHTHAHAHARAHTHLCQGRHKGGHAALPLLLRQGARDAQLLHVWCAWGGSSSCGRAGARARVMRAAAAREGRRHHSARPMHAQAEPHTHTQNAHTHAHTHAPRRACSELPPSMAPRNRPSGLSAKRICASAVCWRRDACRGLGRWAGAHMSTRAACMATLNQQAKTHAGGAADTERCLCGCSRRLVVSPAGNCSPHTRAGARRNRRRPGVRWGRCACRFTMRAASARAAHHLTARMLAAGCLAGCLAAWLASAGAAAWHDACQQRSRLRTRACARSPARRSPSAAPGS
jgi:hypothetical protein